MWNRNSSAPQCWKPRREQSLVACRFKGTAYQVAGIFSDLIRAVLAALLGLASGLYQTYFQAFPGIVTAESSGWSIICCRGESNRSPSYHSQTRKSELGAANSAPSSCRY